MQVREHLKAIGHEREGNARDPRRARRARERARQAERAVAAEGEAEEGRDGVDRQRLHAQSEEREEKKREPVVVLAEGERVVVRVEDVRVEESERVCERLVVVPPERPGDHVRVAAVGHGVAQV